jgi:uncharacterized protein (DUF934 family)
MGIVYAHGSKLSIINIYKEQLDKFSKIGLGGYTENNVLVTEKLINATKQRLSELSVAYESNLTPAAELWRRKRDSGKL